MGEREAEIARCWFTGYDRGAHDYTDAGCRVLAERAFVDIPYLLARVASLEGALREAQEALLDDTENSYWHGRQGSDVAAATKEQTDG